MESKILLSNHKLLTSFNRSLKQLIGCCTPDVVPTYIYNISNKPFYDTLEVQI